MTNFPKPIGRFGDDKNKDWSLPPVEGVEKNKKFKEEAQNLQKKEFSARPLLLASLAICCKNFLTQLLAKERGFGAVDLNQVKEHLLGFKKLLEKLSHEDLSRTITFTRKLSDLWIELHEDLRKIQLFEAETPRIGPDLKTTLDAIGSFPPGADHRLGYYLKEHVGQEWLPFPFMDILSLLYKEHLRRGSRSILTIWLSLLADTLFHFEQGPSA